MHKNKKKYLYLLIGIPIAMFLFVGAVDSVFFKINKSFEIFGELFKEISTGYVEEVDPEDLVRDAIEGMLNNLDPYTIYMDESETDDVDMITTGSYNGLGFTVAIRDEMMTVTDVMDDFPAQKSGIRIGDRLYKIDTTVIINSNAGELRKYTKKPSGTKIDIWVLRDGLEDTLHLNVTIEEINMKNVSYSSIIRDSIGYIKLDRFSRSSTQEVTDALNKLKRTGKLNGLILDLRDNPGGLLESAVGICELFVQPKSVIVSTKGRNSRNDRIYKSNQAPLAPDLPLAVLINGSSASASEILAGAIQDLDRGIIVGEKSYGKGLVQSVYDLPYNAALKITTSKYYIPSGRSIQKINYSRKKVMGEDTIEFFTKNGRKVEELNGIMPDSSVKMKAGTYFIQDLIANDLFFNFANRYASKIKVLPKDFDINQKILDEFNKFVDEQEYFFQTRIVTRIDDLMELIEKEKLNHSLKDKLKNIQKDVKAEEKDLMNKQKSDVSKFLKLEILRRFKTQHDMITYSIEDDEYINTAISLLYPKQYRKILAIEDTSGTKRN
ncbi:MAG: S41 family peptidase [bacterium]